MINVRSILFFLLLNSSQSFCQTKNFKLSDSTFYPGQEIDLDIRFQANARLLIDSVTFKMMDSLKNFVLCHPNLVLEIQCNTDYRGDSLFNMKLSEQRAIGIKNWLEHNGAKAENLKTNSQGERKPIILTPDMSCYSNLPNELKTSENYILTEAFLQQFKADKKLFEWLNHLNRRTVFRIIST